MNNEALETAIAKAGGQTALAKKLGCAPQAISQWKTKGVPGERVIPIYFATDRGVTPYDLRPDLYPDPNWLPPIDLIPCNTGAAA